MPGKKLPCPICSKVMRCDNLKRHMNSCKADVGPDLIQSQSCSGMVSIPEPTNLNYSPIAEISGDESSANDDESDTDIVADESDMDDDSTSRDDEVNSFWYMVYKLSERKDEEHFLESCAALLTMYISSKRDPLFQDIAKQTAELEGVGLDSMEALADATVAQKKAITRKVNRCRRIGSGEGDTESVIWRELADLDVNPWCKLFTTEKCNCEECAGVFSLSKIVAFFVYVFQLIDNDELAQIIVKTTNVAGNELNLEHFRGPILRKYDLLKSKVIAKHPRSLILLNKYLQDIE